MIESVKLIRFKQFRETEVELPPFGILMGGNNAGKTTVLQAVWLALHSLHQGKLLVTDRKTLQTKVSSTGYYTFDVPFLPKEDLNGLFYKKIARGSATYDENSGAIVEHGCTVSAYAHLSPAAKLGGKSHDRPLGHPDAA